MGASVVGQSLSSNRNHNKMTQLDDNSSEEHIVQASAEYHNFKNDIRAGSTNSDRSGGFGDGIMVTKTYEVAPAKSTLDV